MVNSYKPAAAAFALAFFIAGCGTTRQMGASDQVFGYSLHEVDVTVSEDVNTGVFERLDDLEDDEFAEEVRTKLEAALNEAIGTSFSGEMEAQVIVHVDEMAIASGVGRALLGNESYIGANVRVVDSATNATIAERHFREGDKDVMFGGNLGILVEVVKNVGDAAVNDRVDAVAQEFAQAVKDWLEN